MSERHIHQAGLDLIKRFEGLRLKAYKCSGGAWTIGYGSTKGVRQGQVITQAEADRRLREDLEDAEEAVLRLVTVPLNDHEFAAVVSFVFNLGADAFRRSTLRRFLNADDRAGAAREFARWTYAGGKQLQGLYIRRVAEKALFQTPIDPVEIVA